MTTNLPAGFWSRTKSTDCIIWTGAQNSRGYGCFQVDGKSQLVHRLIWEDQRGPIPIGMTIDHLCRVRNCVNIGHLELVTAAENTRRRFKTNGGLDVGGTCANEHPIASEDDVYVNPRGRRECRECRKAAYRRAKAAA